VKGRRTSLFVELSALSIGLTLATSIAIAAFTTHRQLETIDRDLADEATLLAELVALNSEYGIYTESSESLSNLLERVALHPDVEAIAILDEAGGTLAHRGYVPANPARLSIVRSGAASRGRLADAPSGRVYDLTAPVLSGSTLADVGAAEGRRVIGFVRVRISDRRHQARSDALLASVVVVITVLIALAILVSTLIARRITNPIHRLVEAAERIASGRLDITIDVKSTDEVGTLAEAFDVMRTSLDDRNRQLERAVEEANASSAAKTLFLAKMSHELRTPLNAVIGFTEVLIDEHYGEINPTQREYLGDVLGSGRHLLALVDDVLDLSKVESGQAEPRPEAFDLAAMLESTVRAMTELAQKKGVSLDVSIDPQVGFATADPRMIRQVVLNVLANAIKFTKAGGAVTLEADVVDRAWLERNVGAVFEPDLTGLGRGKGFLRVAVRDTGIGIRPESLRRIFEAFQQEDNSIGREYGGTGLGLALSKRIVELHRGVIWVESAPGAGSTFTFVLPATSDS
jgi:signal transduction histidine kinase